MTKISGKWIAAVVLAIAAPSVVAAVGGKGDEAAAARNLTVFNSLYKELLTRYVDTVDAEQSITTAINAMLRELDPYTEYIPADERDDFMSMSTTGEYGGIGSVIRQTKNNGVVIADPYEGSPAATAGLRPGDRIIMIDNDSTFNWTVSQVSDHLKGQANTPVRVVVDRPYVEDSILSFTIVRKKDTNAFCALLCRARQWHRIHPTDPIHRDIAGRSENSVARTEKKSEREVDCARFARKWRWIGGECRANRQFLCPEKTRKSSAPKAAKRQKNESIKRHKTHRHGNTALRAYRRRVGIGRRNRYRRNAGSRPRGSRRHSFVRERFGTNDPVAAIRQHG